MKPSILVLLIFLSSVNDFAQEAPDDVRLELLSGKLPVYYIEGFEERAEYMQSLAEGAVSFYEDLLNDTFSFDLFMLTRKAYRQMGVRGYPIEGYDADQGRIIMPAKGIVRKKLPPGDSILGQDFYYLFDFVMFHEFGHCIDHLHETNSHIKWSNEFLADLIQVAYVHDLFPRLEFNYTTARLFTFLPLKYKSLEKYNSAGVLNNLAYHAKFRELANQLFLKHGFDIVTGYLQIYSQLNKDFNEGKLENITITPELIYIGAISNMQSLDAEIFDAWKSSMRQTVHPWLILSGLLMFIILIRLTNSSYAIFTDNRLHTKGIHRSIGVPAVIIWRNLKYIEPKNNKKKLVRISVLRIINIILISILFIFLMVLIVA